MPTSSRPFWRLSQTMRARSRPKDGALCGAQVRGQDRHRAQSLMVPRRPRRQAQRSGGEDQSGEDGRPPRRPGAEDLAQGERQGRHSDRADEERTGQQEAEARRARRGRSGPAADDHQHERREEEREERLGHQARAPGDVGREQSLRGQARPGAQKLPAEREQEHLGAKLAGDVGRVAHHRIPAEDRVEPCQQGRVARHPERPEGETPVLRSRALVRLDVAVPVGQASRELVVVVGIAHRQPGRLADEPEAQREGHREQRPLGSGRSHAAQAVDSAMPAGGERAGPSSGSC